MKYKITLLLLFVYTIIQSQNVTIPNANFKAKLLSASTANYIAKNLSGAYFKIDANNDGEIQVTEALQVKELNVSSANIISMVGILSFTNLTHLTCEVNYIGSLDVSTLTNLTELKCGANQLTALNVNTLVNLKTLVCYANQIASLDVSNLHSLETLYCYNNQLTSLNMATVTTIADLQCNNNLLTTLDVSNFINLIQFLCYNNQLTSINLTGAVNIRDFRCYNNQLRTIDTPLLINMTFLDCSANPLTNLDLHGLNFLLNLDFSGTPLVTVDATDCIFLNNLRSRFNSSLKSLYIKNGSNEGTIDLTQNTSLNYVCCDVAQLAYVQNQVSISGASNVTVTSTCALGTPEVGQQSITIQAYPNPVKDFINFSNGSTISNILLYDMSGRLIRSEKVSNDKADLSDIKRGVYLVKATANGKTTQFKITKD